MLQGMVRRPRLALKSRPRNRHLRAGPIALAIAIMSIGVAVGSSYVSVLGQMTVSTIWQTTTPGCSESPPPGWSSGQIPGPRLGAAFAYDSTDDIGLLFGGAPVGDSPSGFLNFPTRDTWELHAGCWTQICTTCTPSAFTVPSARFDSAMAYDAADKEFVLFGGCNWLTFNSGTTNMYPDTCEDGTAYMMNDTWTFSTTGTMSTNTWVLNCGGFDSKAACAPTGVGGQNGRYGEVMAYDPTSSQCNGATTGCVYMYGGSGFYPTCSPGGNGCTKTVGPCAYSATYPCLDSLWIFAGNAWQTTAASTAVTGAGRAFAQMAYDGTEMVLFGGIANAGSDAEVTESDTYYTTTATSWTRVATGPPATEDGGIFYDTNRSSSAYDDLVEFGGMSTTNAYSGYTPITGSYWLWSASTHAWTQVTTTAPPGIIGPSEIYDSQNGYGIVMGGVLDAATGTLSPDNQLSIEQLFD